MAAAVFELGTETSINTREEPEILRGPYLGWAISRGWRAWFRQWDEGDCSQWEEKQPVPYPTVRKA